MMPIPDFPVELWLQVLSHLPQGAVRKMIGVNRILYELALDDIYKEIHFTSNDKRMMGVFQRLRAGSMARRVRVLNIQPNFFPASRKGSNQSGFIGKSQLGLERLRSLAAAPLPAVLKGALQNPSFEILDTASKSVKGCQSIQEVKIIFYIMEITPSFVSFMDSLWAADSIGPNIKKLSLDANFVKLPNLLKPLIKFSSSLTNLRVLDLHLEYSPFYEAPAELELSSQTLLSFLTAFKDTFSHLSFSSNSSWDHKSSFANFPYIPNLTNVRFLMRINRDTFPHGTSGFTKFLSKHASNLEVLTIRPDSHHSTTKTWTDRHYNSWLNDEESMMDVRLYSIAQLTFPKLHTFNVGLRSFISGPFFESDPPRSQKLPDLSRVMPNLTKLVITGGNLSFQQLVQIVHSLARREGGSILNEFDYTCSEISPAFFDLLSQKVPSLKSLTLTYQNTVADKGQSFNDSMQARKYPSWDLTYLRLLRVHRAFGHGHPDILDMDIVGACLTQKVVLDATFSCTCLSE